MKGIDNCKNTRKKLCKWMNDDLCTPEYEKVMKQMRLTWKLWKYDYVIVPKGYEETGGSWI